MSFFQGFLASSVGRTGNPWSRVGSWCSMLGTEILLFCLHLWNICIWCTIIGWLFFFQDFRVSFYCHLVIAFLDDVSAIILTLLPCLLSTFFFFPVYFQDFLFLHSLALIFLGVFFLYVCLSSLGFSEFRSVDCSLFVKFGNFWSI